MSLISKGPFYVTDMFQEDNNMPDNIEQGK